MEEMTDSLIKADIFFVITAVAVIVLVGILCWALIRLTRILRNVQDISETIKRETKNIAHDIDAFREQSGVFGGMRAGARLMKKFLSKSRHKHKKGP